MSLACGLCLNYLILRWAKLCLSSLRILQPKLLLGTRLHRDRLWYSCDICDTVALSFFPLLHITLTVSICYIFYSTIHITRSIMSLSCDKENNQFKLTTIRPQLENTSQHTDWVQCTPATPAPASRKAWKAWKASWKPADDELLLECLWQQQANPFTRVTRCDKPTICMETQSTILYISHCLCSGKHRTSVTANNTKSDVKYMQIWSTKTFYCTTMLALTKH